MKTLGFVGTAKNTGKTTTALHMLGLLSNAGYRIGLTSIGYDGENTDHITGLPKPHYHAFPGMTVATAEKCLEFGSARYSQLEPTGLRTILGEIVVATVAEAGDVVLAGPNRRADLRPLIRMLSGRGIDITLLDGALNRMAAMVEADGMILSTGAAFDERIETITDHAAAMEALFHYPQAGPFQGGETRSLRYLNHAGILNSLPLGSVMDEETLREVSGWMKSGTGGRLVVPGVFAPLLFQRLVEESGDHLAGQQIVFASPLNLLATGQPELWRACFDRLSGLGTGVAYLDPIPLHFMTVNPFYPKYLQKTASYVAQFVDKIDLLDSARRKISRTPVVDILQPPHPDLLSICMHPLPEGDSDEPRSVRRQ